jgi:ATP-binding cassette subfamily B protein
MPMSFFNRTKIGRIISRVTSDCEAMRIGVQDVLFVTLVGVGQMAVSAAFMLYYDVVMFAVVAAMTPVMWGLNRYFRRRLSRTYRDVQESFSRITSTLAESANGIRVTQGFVREELNARLFGDLVRDHAQEVQRVRVVGHLVENLAVNQFGLVEFSLPVKLDRVVESLRHGSFGPDHGWESAGIGPRKYERAGDLVHP